MSHKAVVRDTRLRDNYATPMVRRRRREVKSCDIVGKRSEVAVLRAPNRSLGAESWLYTAHVSSMLVRMMDDMDALRTTLLGRLDAIDARVAKIETAFYYSPDGEGAQQAVAEACALAVAPDDEATQQAVAQLAAAANQSPRKRKCEQLDAP